jgi:hypothetical protein
MSSGLGRLGGGGGEVNGLCVLGRLEAWQLLRVSGTNNGWWVRVRATRPCAGGGDVGMCDMCNVCVCCGRCTREDDCWLMSGGRTVDRQRAGCLISGRVSCGWWVGWPGILLGQGQGGQEARWRGRGSVSWQSAGGPA